MKMVNLMIKYMVEPYNKCFAVPSNYIIEGYMGKRKWFHCNKLLEHKNVFKNSNSCLKS